MAALHDVSISAPPPPPPDDAELLARCARGEAVAWEALVHRYQRLVYAIVRRIGLDEHMAADVFQTVFSRLIQHLPRLQDPSRLQAWIVTTTKREALLQRKRGLRTVSMSRDDDADDATDWDFADDTPTAEEALSSLQLHNSVRNAMDRLDPRCRNLLMLLFNDDDDRAMPYEEVARRLGTPIGSIGPTRSRCLDKLRTLVS